MRAYPALLSILLSFLLTGCEAIATIFEAGVWVGVIGVLLILALVAWVVSRARGRR